MDFSELLTALAEDAVRTQRIFDENYLHELEAFSAWLAQTPEGSRDLLFALMPKLQVIAEHRVTTSLVIGRGRSTAFSIDAVPVNMSYSIRFDTRTELLSQMHVTVVRAPLPTPMPSEGD